MASRGIARQGGLYGEVCLPVVWRLDVPDVQMAFLNDKRGVDQRGVSRTSKPVRGYKPRFNLI